MNTEETLKVVQEIIQSEVKYLWIYILLSGIVGALSAIILEFIKTKGKNYATKQDIEELTRKVEKVKGGQQLKFKKINEFYDKTIDLKSHLIKMQTELDEKQDFEKLFNKTKDLLTSMNSDAIFSSILSEESEVIQNDYNEWVMSIENAKYNNQTRFSIDFDKTYSTLTTIQKKILDN